MLKFKSIAGIATLILSNFATAAFAESLKIEVYNPGGKSIFPVSSEIITGKTEAVLIDAQFQRNDAQVLIEKIRKSGKKLSTVFVSHKDPDFYFGLDVIKEAFPDAKIIATPETVKEIKASMEGKLTYWRPILKENAPKKLILPEALEGDSFTIEGNKIEVIGLKDPNPESTFIWIPSIKTVAGGVIVYGNMHLWVADNQTADSRKNWFDSIDIITKLKPTKVVPGHFLGNAPQNLKSVEFTKKYLKTFEKEAEKAKNSAELIERMKKLYPKIGGNTELEMSAKVIKGEMKWPQ
jgi:glyoxylase-like metal-dependent hydrolase (beta-lactamase superfamily II)